MEPAKKLSFESMYKPLVGAFKDACAFLDFTEFDRTFRNLQHAAAVIERQNGTLSNLANEIAEKHKALVAKVEQTHFCCASCKEWKHKGEKKDVLAIDNGETAYLCFTCFIDENKMKPFFYICKHCNEPIEFANDFIFVTGKTGSGDDVFHTNCYFAGGNND